MTRKSKSVALDEAYEKIQRRQEEAKPAVTYPNWINCSQELRNQIIDDFEAAVYEKFGCFPKANWMY